jgi:hypothetical protein
MAINIKLYLYQSWISHVSIQGKLHVVILINYKLLKILIKSIFKTKCHSFACLIATCRCLNGYSNKHSNHLFGLGSFVRSKQSNMNWHANFQNKAPYMLILGVYVCPLLKIHNNSFPF